jgi:dimethylargininase
MFSRFTHAIVRPPARNFADGLTTVDLGVPDVELALAQHAAYCAALERLGCALTRLPDDDRYPDSTFVEDTALILPGHGAILTRPGAESRAGEVEAMRAPLTRFFAAPAQIVAPGTLDAGDVCEAEDHVFIGLSHRTNEAGAAQLTAWLASQGVTAATIDIRETPGILHLKSGVVALDRRTLLAIDALAAHSAFADFTVLRVPAGEAYAANAVRVNDAILVADGFPETHALLRAAGYTLELLDMSEFEKMDGGLSCLSLRF